MASCMIFAVWDLGFDIVLMDVVANGFVSLITSSDIAQHGVLKGNTFGVYQLRSCGMTANIKKSGGRSSLYLVMAFAMS